MATEPAPRPMPRPAPAFSEPQTVRSYNQEKNTLAGGRKVDIREPRFEEARTAASAGDDQPIGRIVDPMVADDDENQGDLYLEAPAAVRKEPVISTARPYARAADPQQRQDVKPLDVPAAYAEEKRGWRSLFGGGRPRFAPQTQPQLRTTAQQQPEPEAQLETAEPQDDLEIPSFLRRLAN